MKHSETESTARAILYAFLANLGIAVSKLATAFYTGSGSMMAESIHSFADTGNQVLLYIGLKGSLRPADVEHPLGYGKLSYFWSFVVALILFTMGGVYSIYEGLHKLDQPGELSDIWIALLVLAGAVVLEGFSLAGAIREINRIRGNKGLLYWLRHTRNAEIVVVFGEDVGAILGLLLAFSFLLVAFVTGNAIYDAAGSICIGVILIVIAVFLAVRLQSLLVGKSAEPELQALINETIANDPYIVAVLNTVTMQFGPRVLLAAKVRMKGDLKISDAVFHLNQLERRIKEDYPSVGWCFLEPDHVP